MANTEKIQALIAKIRESLQITPYATMETVNDLLEIVDLKLADASTGGGGSQVNWGDVQGKPNMDDYAKKTDLESYAQKTELLKTITLTGTTNGSGTVEGTACNITTTAGE
jgi:hypothetical protein